MYLCIPLRFDNTLECSFPQENTLVWAPPLQYYVFAKQNKVGVMYYGMGWEGPFPPNNVVNCWFVRW
jgi:hypothetical protein